MKNTKQQKELQQTLDTLKKTLSDLDGMTSMLDDMKTISEKLKFMDDIDEDTDEVVYFNVISFDLPIVRLICLDLSR